MKKILSLLRNSSQKGDTIVEVLLSMTVLAVVAGAAYATSARSFQAGQNSQFRDQGISYAQQQLELLRNADSSQVIDKYRIATPFCIDPAHLSDAPRSAGSTGCPTPIGGGDSDSQFTVTDSYTGPESGGGSETFIVTVSWKSSTGSPQQAQIHYKASNSFVNTPGGSCPTCVRDPGGLSAAGVQVTLDRTNVNSGETVKISWTSTANIVEGSCAASGSGGWSGAKANSGSNVTSLPLSVDPSTFILTCKDLNGNNVSSDPISVHVGPSSTAPRITSFAADDTSVVAGSGTTLRWGSINTTSCTASGTWSGTKSVRGTFSTGNLSAGSHVYKLTCSGATTADVTVNATSPPPTGYVIFCGGKNYSGTCTRQYNAPTDCSWVVDCGALGNDQISSIKVINTKVAVYIDKGYGGKCTVLNADTSTLSGGFDNNISAFKVGGHC